MDREIKSLAVLAAEQRRIDRAAADAARTEMFVDRCVNTVSLTLHTRVRLAVEYLRSKIVRNISRPVTKRPYTQRVAFVDSAGKVRHKNRTLVKVTNRSKPGEFPKADTTTLLKTIFGEVTKDGPSSEGFVGTPLDYGVILELKKDRSFLLRTFNEERETIVRMIIGTGQSELIR